MRAFAFRVILLCMSAAVVLLVAEILLRVAPSLISVEALSKFPGPLRTTVARRLNLPTNEDAAVIASAERHDGGPPIRYTAPDRTFRLLVDPADRDAGAVSSVRMDSRGFCNPLPKGEWTSADVVVIGDSFTFCTTVLPEQTATALMGESTGLTVYNLGVLGVGPYEYLEILRRYGIPLKPRFVVMNVYEGNDLRDTMVYRAFKKNGAPAATEAGLGARLLSKSYALSFVSAGVLMARDAFRRDAEINFRYSAMVDGVRVPINPANGDLDEARIAGRVRGGHVDVDGFDAPLQTFADLARAHHFTPLVTYVPSTYTAYAGSVVFEDAEVGRDAAELSRVQRLRLAATTARLDLPFLDLTPAFQAAAASGPLTHFPANLHLTARGHQVVATAIAAKLAGMNSRAAGSR